jgi:RNA polymerase sigma-70 factor (ECF subfamily)
LTNDPRQEAFAAHVLPELDVLLRVARSLTGSDADAEDLVQETLVRAFRAIERFDGRHPRAWLLTIMRNAHVNELRRRQHERVELQTALDWIPDVPEHGVEVTALADTFDSVVYDALWALPARYREIIELVDLDGLNYQEAAVAAGVPVGTVMSRLHRARRRMRAALEAAGLGAHGRG